MKRTCIRAGGAPRYRRPPAVARRRARHPADLGLRPREPRRRDRLRSASWLLTRRCVGDEHGRLAAIDDDTGFHLQPAPRRRRPDRRNKGQPRSRAVTAGACHDGGSAPAAPCSPPRPQGRLRTPCPRTQSRRRSALAQFRCRGRLVAMGDALGHRARYTWDRAAASSPRRSPTGAAAALDRTCWRYDGSRLLEVDHPKGRERHEYDQRGLRSARIVSLKRDGDELVVVTRYEYDAEGHLVATTLPDRQSPARAQRPGSGRRRASRWRRLIARAGARTGHRQRVRARSLRPARLPGRQRYVRCTSARAPEPGSA